MHVVNSRGGAASEVQGQCTAWLQAALALNCTAGLGICTQHHNEHTGWQLQCSRTTPRTVSLPPTNTRSHALCCGERRFLSGHSTCLTQIAAMLPRSDVNHPVCEAAHTDKAPVCAPQKAVEKKQEALYKEADARDRAFDNQGLALGPLTAALE